MRFMLSLPACRNDARKSEAFDAEFFTTMMKFNEEMTRAGVLVTAEGVTPGGERARVVASNGKKTVLDGPFSEAKEVVGAFYVIEVASREEAIQWALRHPGGDGEIDIRQLTEISELPAVARELVNSVASSWRASLVRSRPS